MTLDRRLAAFSETSHVGRNTHCAEAFSSFWAATPGNSPMEPRSRYDLRPLVSLAIHPPRALPDPTPVAGTTTSRFSAKRIARTPWGGFCRLQGFNSRSDLSGPLPPDFCPRTMDVSAPHDSGVGVIDTAVGWR